VIRACVPALAWLGGLFATLGALLWLGADACLDRGGRNSDSAWVCEYAQVAGREPESLWSYVTWPQVVAATLMVGVPIVLLVRRIGRRWNACSIEGAATERHDPT
jgi:hypothetical protein